MNNYEVEFAVYPPAQVQSATGPVSIDQADDVDEDEKAVASIVGDPADSDKKPEKGEIFKLHASFVML